MPRDGDLRASTPRLYPLRPHAEQAAFWGSRARFCVVPAGRRSGKTEIAKRRLLRKAWLATKYPDSRFFAAAPTRDQAKRVFWNDMKLMVPRRLMAGHPLEADLIIRLINGAEIHVVGMDKPERIEGSPWDGGIMDEFGNTKPGAWEENVRPALSDRRGTCDLIGVPEGRNHYYDTWKYAISGIDPEWAGFTWFSSDILPTDEIEAARRVLDELTFQQEYEGSFVSFEGRAYYPFTEAVHCAPLEYNPSAPLSLCFDFNVDPGVCAAVQEMELPNGLDGTGIVGEVYIPRNSNTPAVCRKVLQLWGNHQSYVRCYGDATGGNRGTAKVEGSDWEIIKRALRTDAGDGRYFSDDQITFKVGRQNPPERTRINAVNSRLKSATGEVRLMVNPATAPHTVRDFEGVQLLKGGSGEIDKKADGRLTHLTDAIGYYVHEEFPVVRKVAEMRAMF